MGYVKELKRIHKEFLAERGLKSKDYKLISEDAESYTFYNQRTGKEEVFRR